MTKQRKILLASIVLVAALAGTATAGAPEGPGGNSPIVLPAGAFASDGDVPYGYYIPGQYISGGTNVRLRAAVYLPALAYVTDFIVVARDENSSVNGYFYLKEAPFGVIGETNTIATVQTTGSDTAMQYPADYHVDRQINATENIYWVEASLPADDVYLYSVHLHFNDDGIFADGFESADTAPWSGGAGLKSVTIDGWTPVVDTGEPATHAIPDWMNIEIEDVEAREALEHSLKGTENFGSPLVVPGGAFKTVGGIDSDDYYISPVYGFVYARPNLRAKLVAPINLPQGANISHLMFFYRDSNPSQDIEFSLSRMNTWNGAREDLLAESTSGSLAAIRSLTYTSSDLTTSMIDNSHFSHWVTIDLAGFNFVDDYWHEVYAIVVLYTLP
jgi:hypothetical protein